MILDLQKPRVCSIPDYHSTTGKEAIELASMAGLVLDPWEAFVLEHALGEKPGGRWAAFEVGLVVPRQNGKGAILEARELAGLFLLKERLIIHSAHQFDTSLEAFRRLLFLIEDTPDLDRRVKRVSKSHGEEGVELKNGCRIRFRTRTSGGGRGFTGDCLILDEAMVLPESFHGALLPTLSARSVVGNPQVWYTGSAVDQTIHEHGVVLARVRERGHQQDPDLAYFEWSVHRETEDGKFTPDKVTEEVSCDEGAWAEANPGLGIRISAEHVEKERRALGAREFAVERLGVGDWPVTDGSGQQVISLEQWDALKDPASEMVDPVAFALDVPPDRSSATISAAGARPDGLPMVEVIEQRRGTKWVVEWLAERIVTHEPVAVVYDGTGPVASLIPALEEALQEAGVVRLELTAVTAREHANACGMLYDTVDQAQLRHRGTSELRQAVKGAVKRELGDAWAWSRKNSSIDISPLVSCTLALWAFETTRPVNDDPMVAFV